MTRTGAARSRRPAMAIGRWAGALLSAVIALTATPAAQDWRALALASFDEAWQTINDTFYDPTFGGVDWAGVGKELRPKVQAASSPDDARAVLREMLARLHRSHFALLAPTPGDVPAGPADVPAEIRLTAGGEVIVTRVTDESAAADGLTAGQTLLAIDGRPVADLVEAAQGADARTRTLDAWRRVSRALTGPVGSVARLAARGPGGESLDLRVTRLRPSGEVITLGNLPPLRVQFEAKALSTPAGRSAGYIAFSVWLPVVMARIDQAVDEYRNSDGLVIDLRGNPGGVAAMMNGVAGHVIAERVALGTMRTRQAPEPLTFWVNPRRATADGRTVKPFAGPVAILVDELTGSTSETFTGSLQSLGRARIFGRPTMGQALPALTRTLPNGDVLMHAVGDYVTSTGRSLEGGGVVPDEVVPLSAEALSAGHDGAVDAALRWFDSVKRSTVEPRK
jgi:carboxyl-terminal processing protease